jgi:hypothetical protein
MCLAALAYAADGGHAPVVQCLLEVWGQPAVTAAALVHAAKLAAGRLHKAAYAVLAKELQRLYPAESYQQFEGQYPVLMAFAFAAVIPQWVSEVSSVDERQAALHQHELDVAREKKAAQSLLLSMACMAKNGHQGSGDVADEDDVVEHKQRLA